VWTVDGRQWTEIVNRSPSTVHCLLSTKNGHLRRLLKIIQPQTITPTIGIVDEGLATEENHSLDIWRVAQGLDLARDLTEDGPVVVFVTAFSRYAPEAFDVSASDYVLKPFSDRRFNEALLRAKRRVRERRLGDLATRLATLSSELRPDDQPPEQKSDGGYLQRLSFREGDRTIVIQTAELIWIEAEDYYVRIHSSRGRHLVRTPLTTLEGRLNPLDFVRVHRGALINVQAVTEVRDAGGLTLVLTDGAEVPVSRSRRAAVESSLLPRRNTRSADRP